LYQSKIMQEQKRVPKQTVHKFFREILA
jgi:hypothetical protein